MSGIYHPKGATPQKLVRDPHSKAILNADVEAKKEYEAKRAVLDIQNARINNLEVKMTNIEDMLKKLLEINGINNCS